MSQRRESTMRNKQNVPIIKRSVERIGWKADFLYRFAGKCDCYSQIYHINIARGPRIRRFEYIAQSVVRMYLLGIICTLVNLKQCYTRIVMLLMSMVIMISRASVATRDIQQHHTPGILAVPKIKVVFVPTAIYCNDATVGAQKLGRYLV